MGDALFAEAGHLPQSLALAKVAPVAVTDIFISHAHSDHETLAKLAADHARVFAVHCPFPGIGQVVAEGQGLVWKPEAR